MQRSAFWIALSAVVLCWVPRLAASEPARPALADRGEVDGIVAGFESAWNRHDTRALAALFAGDADFVNVIGLHWHGRDQIEKAHAEIHATRMKDSHLTLLSRTVRQLRSDVGVVHAVWELRGDTGLDGHVMAPRRGVLSFVIARTGGRWQIVSAQNTDIVPLPNAPPAK